jgi:hypothetical protein
VRCARRRYKRYTQKLKNCEVRRLCTLHTDLKTRRIPAPTQPPATFQPRRRAVVPVSCRSEWGHLTLPKRAAAARQAHLKCAREARAHGTCLGYATSAGATRARSAAERTHAPRARRRTSRIFPRGARRRPARPRGCRCARVTGAKLRSPNCRSGRARALTLAADSLSPAPETQALRAAFFGAHVRRRRRRGVGRRHICAWRRARDAAARRALGGPRGFPGVPLAASRILHRRGRKEEKEWILL